MFDDEMIISGFESQSVVDAGPIDFSLATKLDRGGSTCDVYVTRYHRRRVFIKRLKEEFRNNTVYRAALDKEFEIGVSLSHKSLAEYRELHDDYIVIDYIEGVTLAEIMSGKNPELLRWLKRPANLSRMVSELIEVVDYLHRHNVVHCDIKADNIILTDETRNLMLIDFDKAFTSWYDDTHGSAALYGVDPGHDRKIDMDFRGIGKIILRLREAGLSTKKLERIRKKCFEEGVVTDDLKAILEKRNGRGFIMYLVTFISLLTVVAVWFISNISNDRKKSEEAPMVEAVAEVEPEMEKSDSLTVIPVQHDEDEVEPEVEVEPDFETIVGRELKPLYLDLDKLMKEVGDSAIAVNAIMDALMGYVSREEEVINEACRKVRNSWHFETGYKGNERAMMTEAYSRFRKYSDSVQRAVSDRWRERSGIIQ